MGENTNSDAIGCQYKNFFNEIKAILSDIDYKVSSIIYVCHKFLSKLLY